MSIIMARKINTSPHASLRTRTLPLEIAGDHLLVRLRNQSALLDTGSPLTLRAPRLVSERIGQSVRWIVGTDSLRSSRVLIDWPARCVVVNGHPLYGETVSLRPKNGIFEIPIQGPFGSTMAILDSGAWLSYAPASAVAGLARVGQRRDFSVNHADFETDVYQLRIAVGTREIDAQVGVLPDALAAMLIAVGGNGWVLGSDFFRDRAIQLDLGNNCLMDAPSSAGRLSITRPSSRSSTVPSGGTEPRILSPRAGARSAIRETNARVEGWRGWRLQKMSDGTPRLQSLSSRDVWEGPVFVSDRAPELRGHGSASGVHAYSAPSGLSSIESAAIVYGQVTLYGRVAVHEIGYRAERARIDRLFLRACGCHRMSHEPDLRDLFGLMPPPTTRRIAYCGCRNLAHDEWLSHEELQILAGTLAAQYQCDVTVDLKRARTFDSHCRATFACQPSTPRSA